MFSRTQITAVMCSTSHMTDYTLDLTALAQYKMVFAPGVPSGETIAQWFQQRSFYFLCTVYLGFVVLYGIALWLDRRSDVAVSMLQISGVSISPLV